MAGYILVGTGGGGVLTACWYRTDECECWMMS